MRAVDKYASMGENRNVPDDLLQRAEIAATEGRIKHQDDGDALPTRKGRSGPIPVRIEGTDWTFPYLTNADLLEAVNREERWQTPTEFVGT
jgi:hypothetical protein